MIILGSIIVSLLYFNSPAFALLDYQISFVSTTEDPDHAGLLGFDTWFQWLYKVNVIEGEKRNGLSHFTLELEMCIAEDEELLAAIASTAGANGVAPNDGNLSGLMGNEFRSYNIESGLDGSTGIEGVKWELLSDNFEDVGDYDYFWFSAPTDEGGLHDGVVKHGRNLTFHDVLTPGCDHHVIPEPSSLFLMGSGILGAFVVRRKRKRS